MASHNDAKEANEKTNGLGISLNKLFS